jgi:hypothetical protein
VLKKARDVAIASTIKGMSEKFGNVPRVAQ